MQIKKRKYDITLRSDGFYLYDTKGIALDTQLELAHERGQMVSLLDFYLDAIKAGWTHEKTKAVIEGACMDVFGKVPSGIF